VDPAGQLCYTDAYLRSVEALVIAVDGGEAPIVVLDRTVFYPGGGGQPSDRGTILRSADGRSWTIRGAQKSGSDIVHELEPGDDGRPEVGDVVSADLDWTRRLTLMRTHTALHALCGVVWRDYGALETGGNMEPGSGRMDFEFETMSGELVGGSSEGQRRAGRWSRCASTSAARPGVRHPRPHPDESISCPRGSPRSDIEIVGLDSRRWNAWPTRRGRRAPGHRLQSKGRISSGSDRARSPP
jgi:hypothetical protein